MADMTTCQELNDEMSVKLAIEKNEGENENLEIGSPKQDSKVKQENSSSGYTSTKTDLIIVASTDESGEKQDANMQVKRQSDDELTFESTAEDKVNSCNDKNNENAKCSSLKENKDKKRPCDPCLFDDVNETANSFCVVCVEYLCKSCARDHRRSKATRNHKVIIEADIPDDPTLFKMMKSLASCPDHPEMDVSYKCKTHEKFICTKCLVVSHRKCEEVIEISNLITQDKTIAETDTHTALPNTLQSVYEMIVSVRNAKEENIKQLRINSSCIHAERSEYIKLIQEQLMKLDEKCMTETDDIATKTLKEIEKDIDKCNEVEEKILQQKLLLDVGLSYGNTTEVNLICEKVEKDIKGYKDETTKQEAKPAVSLKFDRNKSLEEIASLGSVRVVKGRDDEDCQEKVVSGKETVIELSSDELGEKTVNVGEYLQSKSFMQSSVSKRRIMYDIKSSQSTEKCSITSMVIMFDGTIVLADYSNKLITVLNKDWSIRLQKELTGKPIDVCQYLRIGLGVIVDGVKYVNKYLIGDDAMYNYGEFPCKLYPLSIGSITSIGDRVIILFSDEEKPTPKRSDRDQIEIQIRSMNDGKILQTLIDFRNKSSLKMILDNPGRIRIMKSTPNAFLVSENMKLHCVETDKDNSSVLKEKWYFKSYKGNIIAEITDIAVDKEGNIYVCGKSSKNIHQISGAKYMQNRVLLTVTGIPLSLCVDNDNRQLIVGCENDDFIYVIKLE